MEKVFLVPGLGADERLFKYIELKKFNVTAVNWITPDAKDTLRDYAARLIQYYHINHDSVVIGVSLGGMLAVEIANLIKPKKTIIISSIKISKEAPLIFKLYKYIPLYKLLSEQYYGFLTMIAKPFFGKFSREDWKVFDDMFKRTPASFMKWAIEAILNWENFTVPDNLYHLIGNRDLIFSYKKINNAKVIRGGTHMMVFDKAEEINYLINEFL